MNKKVILTFMALLLAVSAFALAPQGGKFSQKAAQALDTDTWIDANSILMFVTNKGSFAYDQGGFFGKNDGLYYPFTSVQDIEDGANVTSVLFASGIWVAGVDNASGDTLVTVAEYSDDYFPGPIVDTAGGPPTWTSGADVLSQYKVYKLYKDSLASNPNSDYTNWPVAQGAPVDSLGNPAMVGDQMCWSVYNDINPGPHVNDAASDSGLGVEIRQTTFAFDRADALANIVFTKLQIYNRGGRDLSNVKLTLWSDPDLGDAGDDFVGSDTVLSLAYCYNSTNKDASYGSRPPCVGYDFFQGPLIFTGDNADTATMWNFQKFPGYLNMPMTAMMMYRNGEDPASPTETYQYMSGLQAKLGGAPLANGTTFYAPGDPVTGTGDLDNNASDRRYMLTTGPFDFPPGDSTEILCAVVVGQGGDRLSSISVLRYNDKFAQQAYDNEFDLLEPPASPEVTGYQFDGEVVLEWTDTSEVSPGDYPFQGYTVFQGGSSTGPWTKIGNFDIDDGVAIILDEVLDPLTGVLEQRAVRFGSDNGIRRFFGTSLDALNGGPLNNHTDYFYRVEAYSYNSDPQASPKTLNSATNIKITPQEPTAGTQLSFDFADTIPVTHVSGISDGAVIPYLIDPGKLTGDSYMVSFSTDSILGAVWHLFNTTTGDTVLYNQANQTGDEDYTIVDGILLKVTGPAAPGMKDWSIPSGVRRWTFSGADGFAFEGFNGAMGWGGPSDTHGFGSNDPVDPSLHVSVLFILAQVDTLDGSDSLGSFTFDPNDPNVSYAYRYGRGFTAPPAQAKFAPYMIDVVNGGYRFQDFTQSVPLSAWNVDVNPPQRLAVGFLENNAANGRVDGVYFPGSFNFYNNTDGAGPREWLWVYLEDYSTTPNPAYMGDATSDPMPVLWWSLVNRRGEVPYSPGGTGEDQFLLLSNHVNTANDTFTFVATSPAVSTSGEQFLQNVRAVPNPYYLSSSYDVNTTSRRMKFTNLPATCAITIYNLAGHFVERIEKNSGTTSELTWDLTNDNNVPVASGIYIYVVDAPGFGQKVGKMAIFTEIEVLGQY
ncbi:MAG TPA: hypothetical protein VHP63_03100 [candidate division Zixibacteria bacterium]|nr:hypothetical protein [candidate division Zixibacteria bacterium]